MTHEITLAGNFGEPRPNHFHGGLDITTQREEGKAVRAIGDGYVSRIVVSLTGCGNALYVTHADGHTSAYFHLQRFTPRLERLLQQYQYAHEQHEVDFRLSADKYPVAQGQLIAFSGNTGTSFGPHLHLEIQETATGRMLDPLEFLGAYVNDTVAPRVHGVMAYPQPGTGLFNGLANRQQVKGDTATAWGRIGFAVWADDYMQNMPNHYGIRHTSFLVDGREVFSADVNGVLPHANRMVNSWGDYDYYWHQSDWYLKSFIEPGNTLSVLQADEQRGIVDINEERDYHFEYVLKDYFGNTSRYAFTVRGRHPDTPLSHVQNQRVPLAQGVSLLRWNRTGTVSLPGLQLVVPRGNLGDDVALRPVVIRDSAMTDDASFLSSAYRLAPVSCPLFRYAELSIHVSSQVADTGKLYIVFRRDKNNYYVRSTYADGWVTGQVRDLGGTFTLAYDDVAPTIELKHDGQVVRADVKDAGSGVNTCKAYVDGQFVLFKRVPRSTQLVCRLSDTPLKRIGGQRTLKFVATDNCGNEATAVTEIKY